jgi:hypothetical protein
MFSPFQIDSDNHELFIVRHTAGPAPFVGSQVRQHLSSNPNYLSATGWVFFTTGENLNEEIADAGPRPKASLRSFHETPILAASRVG